MRRYIKLEPKKNARVQFQQSLAHLAYLQKVFSILSHNCSRLQHSTAQHNTAQLVDPRPASNHPPLPKLLGALLPKIGRAAAVAYKYINPLLRSQAAYFTAYLPYNYFHIYYFISKNFNKRKNNKLHKLIL